MAKDLEELGELGDWERALTIHVGTAYGCRKCGNIAMVTRGGVGMMELICCGQPMEKKNNNHPEENGK